jgi:hypothetical protein
MGSIGGNSSFQPLSEKASHLETTLNSLEEHKFSIFSKEEFQELNTKLETLSYEIKLLNQSGYKLNDKESHQIKSLADRSTRVLEQRTFSIAKLAQKTFASDKQEARQKALDSSSYLKEVSEPSSSESAFSMAAWVGTLAKEGRSEEAFSITNSITDPTEKAQAYVEIIKTGQINSVMAAVQLMNRAEVTNLIESLNSEIENNPIQDNLEKQHCLTSLKSLPAALLLANGPEEGIEAANQITNPTVKMKAYVQLAASGGIHKLYEHLGALPPDQKIAVLSQLKQELTSSRMDKADSTREFAEQIDLDLEFLTAKKETPTEQTETKKSRFRSIRKQASNLTGKTGFFSGKKKETPVEDSSSPAVTDQESYSSKSSIPENTSSEDLGSLNSSASSEETPDSKKDAAHQLSAVTGSLGEVISSMTQTTPVDNFSYEPLSTGGVQARFSLGKCKKQAPEEASFRLIQGVLGGGEASQKRADSAAKSLEITAYFPANMAIETGSKMTEAGDFEKLIAFPNPKEAISLDFKGQGIVVPALLIAKGLNGHVGVQKITNVIDSNGYSNMVISFSRYTEETWTGETVEVPLGEEQGSAIAFWDLIAATPNL